MAKLGFRTVNEMVGRTDKLKISERKNMPDASVDAGIILAPEVIDGDTPYATQKQDHKLDKAIDLNLKRISESIDSKKKITIEEDIYNYNRTVGTIISSEITKYGSNGLPDDTITINFKGSAGQSFGHLHAVD